MYRKYIYRIISFSLILLEISVPIFSQEDLNLKKLFFYEKIELIFCDTINSQEVVDELLDKYIFEVTMKESFNLSPNSQMRLEYEDTIVLNEAKYIKLLPADFGFKIKLSDNLSYFQNRYKDNTSTINICVEDLYFESIEEKLLINDFFKDNDTLYINVFQLYNHSNNYVKHKFWKSGDDIYSVYDYHYSCSGPIGSGMSILNVKDLENLLILEKNLDGINYDYSGEYSIKNSSANQYYYTIKYGNHGKSGLLLRGEEQKLLLESGLFKTR